MPDLPRAGAVRVGRGVAGRAPLHAVAVGAVSLGYWHLAGRRFEINRVALYSGRIHFEATHTLAYPGDRAVVPGGTQYVDIYGRDGSVIVQSAPLYLSAGHTAHWSEGDPDGPPPTFTIVFPIALTDVTYGGPG